MKNLKPKNPIYLLFALCYWAFASLNLIKAGAAHQEGKRTQTITSTVWALVCAFFMVKAVQISYQKPLDFGDDENDDEVKDDVEFALELLDDLPLEDLTTDNMDQVHAAVVALKIVRESFLTPEERIGGLDLDRRAEWEAREQADREKWDAETGEGLAEADAQSHP